MNEQQSPPTAAGLIRLHQVRQLVPVSRALLYQWIKESRFPAPIKIGPKLSFWRTDEVQAFIDAQQGKVQ